MFRKPERLRIWLPEVLSTGDARERGAEAHLEDILKRSRAGVDPEENPEHGRRT